MNTPAISNHLTPPWADDKPTDVRVKVLYSVCEEEYEDTLDITYTDSLENAVLDELAYWNDAFTAEDITIQKIIEL